MERYTSRDTIGDWYEYTSDDVVTTIFHKACIHDINEQEKDAECAAEFFDEARASILSFLSNAMEARPNDKFIIDLREQAEKLKLISANDFIRYRQPGGTSISRDMAAIVKKQKKGSNLLLTNSY
jgi:hypothetical protein